MIMTTAAASHTRIALITGANKGIGLETAKQLARQGITVLIGSRDEARGRAAAESLVQEKLDARFVLLDVTDQASIMAAAQHIERVFGRLDILINNAGVIRYDLDGPPSRVTTSTLRDTFETNYFSMVALTNAVIHLIKRSDAGRIVNLTSILGSIAEHADPNSTIYSAKLLAYDSSKAAVNMFTNHLAHELRDTKIKVNAAHPGWVKTDMGGANAPMEIVDGAKTSVWLATLPDDGPTGGYYHMQVHMRW